MWRFQYVSIIRSNDPIELNIAGISPDHVKAINHVERFCQINKKVVIEIWLQNSMFYIPPV